MKCIVLSDSPQLLKLKNAVRISKVTQANNQFSCLWTTLQYTVIADLPDEDRTYLTLLGIHFHHFEAPANHKFKVGDELPYLRVPEDAYRVLYDQYQDAGI